MKAVITRAKSSRAQRASPAQCCQHPAILLVENEVIVRLFLNLMLESHLGAKVVEAASNAQAFRAAKRQKFDLVISDLSRPGGDGLTFLREFKALHPGIPVVVHSGQTTAIRQRARRLGASACISKPITLAKLKIVERVLTAAG